METKTVCPKCGSDQLNANKRGFNAGKAVGGLLIPGGLLWGFQGSGKITITCLACGNQFKPGHGKIIKTEPPSNHHSQEPVDTFDNELENKWEYPSQSINETSNNNSGAGNWSFGRLMAILITIIVLWWLFSQSQTN